MKELTNNHKMFQKTIMFKRREKEPQEIYARIPQYTSLLALAHTSHNSASVTSQVGVKMCDVSNNVRYLFFMTIYSTSTIDKLFSREVEVDP